MNKKKTLPSRLRLKDKQPPLRVSVGWYTAEEWAKVKATATDPERFESSFLECEVMAEESMDGIRAAGLDPQKRFIIASELLAWCLVHWKENSASSRAEFVSRP